MSKLIEILPNIYGVKVPSDADGFRISEIYTDEVHFVIPLIKGKGFESGRITMNIKLDSTNYKLLGFLTKDEISFDASEIVDSTEIDIEQYDGILVATPRFWDYETESFSLSNSNESFRSALPEEIFFEHPEGDLKYCCNSSDCGCLGFPINIVSKEHWEDYQITQENITEKLLILQKL